MSISVMSALRASSPWGEVAERSEVVGGIHRVRASTSTSRTTSTSSSTPSPSIDIENVLDLEGVCGAKAPPERYLDRWRPAGEAPTERYLVIYPEKLNG